MLGRAIAGLCLMAAMLLPAWANASQTFEYGIDRPGNDIHSELMPNGSAERECRELCLPNADCQSWTYVKPGIQHEQGVCYLKSGLPGYQNNDCCISGVMERIWEVNIDRPGNDFQSFPTPSARECAAECVPDKNGCRAWTFDANNGTCFLKKPVPDAWPNGCCTSGVGLPSWTKF